MSEPILVTGATGTVGREVVRQLLAAGKAVRASARAPAKPAFLGAAQYVPLDFDDMRGAALAFRDIRRAFLLTPLEERMVDVGCGLVEQAKAAGIEHLVRMSALGANDSPATQLARSHRAVEECIEASGLRYTFLRPNAFMQNYLTAFGYDIRSRGVIAAPQGRGAVSVVDVRDVAAVAVAALCDVRHQNKAYELTGPEPLSNDDVAQILSEILARTIRYVAISESETRTVLLGQGMSSWLVAVLLELYAISRQGLAAQLSPAVEEILGRPPTGFRRFAMDCAEQFR